MNNRGWHGLVPRGHTTKTSAFSAHITKSNSAQSSYMFFECVCPPSNNKNKKVALKDDDENQRLYTSRKEGCTVQLSTGHPPEPGTDRPTKKK